MPQLDSTRGRPSLGPKSRILEAFSKFAETLGRVLMNAETIRGATQSRYRTCFNGAAFS